MCPDCQRIASENLMLQRAKQAADRLLGVVHVRYTGDSTDLSRLLRREIAAYNEVVKDIK